MSCDFLSVYRIYETFRPNAYCYYHYQKQFFNLPYVVSATVVKVGEIFTAAGVAFNKLGDLTMQLHPTSEPSPTSGKWTPKEIEMLQNSVKRFGDDLDKISNIIKTRTISQIKTQLKRKSFEEAGVPMPTDQSPKKVAVQKQTIPTPGGAAHTTHTKKQKHNDVTLSALNAPESDIDIEGDSSSSKKLEFDSDVDSSML
ncbi:BPTF-associated chromatin complex component 1-like isoform X2 [Mytilus galloprovincialis]|uniref:BPTF-associated chromatin complex component 1-like isoform X2 n=1 Tax=Mytilus galloprovincialis TaxID=29158 RepID=UPI003F7BC580